MTATQDFSTTYQELIPHLDQLVRADRIEFRTLEIVFLEGPEVPENCTLLDYKMPPRQFGAPLHAHKDLHESFTVLSGELWMQVEDKEVIAKAGTTVDVPPGVKHAFANNTDQPVRLVAYASDKAHREFLKQVFAIAKNAAEWPLPDPTPIIELGARYDTVYG